MWGLLPSRRGQLVVICVGLLLLGGLLKMFDQDVYLCLRFPATVSTFFAIKHMFQTEGLSGAHGEGPPLVYRSDADRIEGKLGGCTGK